MLLTRLETIELSYGTRAVFNDVSLSLNDDEKIGLVGPNGAGKSSLLKVLAGIDKPQGGERTLRRGAICAYLPQDLRRRAATGLRRGARGRSDLQAIEASSTAGSELAIRLSATISRPTAACSTASPRCCNDTTKAVVPGSAATRESLLIDLGIAAGASQPSRR